MAPRRGVGHDLPVPAADGAVLRVDHHPPATGTGDVVVWIRTPYGRRGMASIAKRFAKCGAHVLVEALRGTDGSQGTFDGIAPHPGDGADVAAWLRGRPWFPGQIVTWGLSAIGYASWGLTQSEIPEWRLAILQDAPSEIRDALVYPGGIFAGAVTLGFVEAIDWQRRHPRASLARTMAAAVLGARRGKKALAGLPIGDVDRRLLGHRVDYLQQWLAHEDDDAYWQRLDMRRHAAGMPDAVHLATGWYDVCLASTLADYRALRAVGRSVRLVIGPWYHARGSVDKAYVGEVNACVDAIRQGEKPISGVRVHVGGGAGWRELPEWPPAGYVPAVWHLQPAGGLWPEPAPASAPDRYRYDPADPTPAVGGAMENWDGNAGAKDNRRLEARSDVLVYSSDVLRRDVEVIGDVRATITMRSSLEHTDIVARLCDVDPAGRSVNLCDGASRLRPGRPEAAPDGTRTVEIDLVAVAHRFRAGHRIRLQICSGAHPRLVRNTGTGAPLATATELRAADQEIFHDPACPSTLTLPCREIPDSGR